MSVCSDVYLTREEAKSRVKNKLMRDHEFLIDSFVNKAESYELSSILNRDEDYYYYRIEKGCRS